MPKTASKSPSKKSTTNKDYTIKRCGYCGKVKQISEFFMCAKSASTDEHTLYCKDCCKDYPLKADGTIDYFKFRDLLIKIDKPLFYDSLYLAEKQTRKEHPNDSEEEIQERGRNIVARYFRNVAIGHMNDYTYSDSEKLGFIHSEGDRLPLRKDDLIRVYGRRFQTGDLTDMIQPLGAKVKDFEVTQDVIDMFGEGYSPSQYKKMSEKYENLCQNYIVQTTLHQEALITYVRFKVKEELATADGHVDEAKKWYSAAQDAADKAKLSPKQLTNADLQKGLNSFSEISQALEQEVDIIETLPRYKSHPNDSVDFNIWCYINYARKLKGLPTVDYSEVYQFYDNMKAEYLSQYGDPYGIFEDDMTVKNRDNIEKFIVLPSDYDDEEDEGSEAVNE